jgi:hypothetical protein
MEPDLNFFDFLSETQAFVVGPILKKIKLSQRKLHRGLLKLLASPKAKTSTLI